MSEDSYPFQVLIWVKGEDHPKSPLDWGRWVEWARCTSRVKADDVAACLAIRNTDGVQAAELVNDRFVGYKFIPESARELGAEKVRKI